jgi:hypothetical protein
MGKHLHKGGEHDLGMATELVCGGRAAALKMHDLEINAGHELEELGPKMLEGADAH